MAPATASSSNNCANGYGGGCDANNIDVAGGASGSSDGSFNLPTGGLIAIAVTVVIVILLGVASTVLYVLAKRRNWQVRKTIARASRRLTGRAKPASSKRHGTVVQMPQPSESRTRDIEKGRPVREANAMAAGRNETRYPVKNIPPPRYTERAG